MSANKPISVPASQATSISPDLRNNIYSALLASDGIRNIEAAMDRQLAETGFKDELKRYVTDILRTGQATTFEEARNLVLEMVFAQMRGEDDAANGVNGLNGTNGAHADEAQNYKLKLDEKVIKEGTRVVRRELEKVCEITEGDES